jgi:hypothetical protein
MTGLQPLGHVSNCRWIVHSVSVWCGRRDPWIGVEALLRWVVEDVEGLVAEVVFIDYAVGVVALLPYLAWEFLAYGEGESAFDQLGAAFDGNVLCWGKQDVDVVGHDDEGVELEFSGIAITEERGDEEFSDSISLEDTATLVGDGGEDVGLGLEAHYGRACPGG